MPGTSPTWRNWAGNQAAAPRRVLTPRTPEDVAEAVASAAQADLPVRMTGSGHSFTPAAVTDGVLLRPGGLQAIRSTGPGAGLVTVEAAAGDGEDGSRLVERDQAPDDSRIGSLHEETAEVFRLLRAWPCLRHNNSPGPACRQNLPVSGFHAAAGVGHFRGCGAPPRDTRRGQSVHHGRAHVTLPCHESESLSERSAGRGGPPARPACSIRGPRQDRQAASAIARRGPASTRP